MSDSNEKILTVIGIGSSFSGDDRIGLDLVKLAEPRIQYTDVEFKIFDSIDPLFLAGELVELGKNILLVDCADMGSSPGEFIFFDFDEDLFALKNNSVSSHGIGLAEGISLARKAGFSNKVKIFGIQPYDISISEKLSVEMAGRMDFLSNELFFSINEYRQELITERVRLNNLQ